MDREFYAKAEIFTAAKDLAAKLKSFKANYRNTYNELNEAVFEDIDLNLGDVANILYSLIGILQND